MLRLPAPAKINLFLHITGRRANGYHELQTIFQLIDLCDWLEFAPRTDGQLILHSDLDVPPEHNLIIRAARALQQATDCTHGADIWLDKHLPMGGGIGGGSSDAATTLLGLNHLWQTGCSIDQLASLGLSLGADVPVFVRGQNAWAEGVGEQLTPVSLPATDYILLKPDCFISTGELFSKESLTRDSAITTFAAYQVQPSTFGNNFEPLAKMMYPAVAQALDYLSAFGQPRLTGTGACVFMPVDTSVDVAQILAQAPCQGWLCQSLDQSPVHQLLS